MRELNQIIQQRRKFKGLSQAEVAEVAGVTQAMVSKVENGKDVRLSTLQAVAEAVGLQLTALTGEEYFQLQMTKGEADPSQSLLERYEVRDDD